MRNGGGGEGEYGANERQCRDATRREKAWQLIVGVKLIEKLQFQFPRNVVIVAAASCTLNRLRFRIFRSVCLHSAGYAVNIDSFRRLLSFRSCFVY